MGSTIIDAHAHCGRQDSFPPQDLEDYLGYARGTGIRGAVMFAPVMEIYDRYDPRFSDTQTWKARREEANSYLLHLGGADFEVIPYFFIWNDFAVEQLAPGHRGIKWHRHADEPVYDYHNPRCRAAVEEIGRRNMPVVLEEELHNTIFFIDRLAPGLRVIIPHLGLLNGGYEPFVRQNVWERPNVYADTALAPAGVIADYIRRYGHSRLMFGSDFPFGDPASELRKILGLEISDSQRDDILGLNLLRLIEHSNTTATG